MRHDPHEIWRLRATSYGPQAKASPALLWAACCEYFELIESNPLQEEKLFSSKMGVERAVTSKMRAMSLRGLLVFIGLTRAEWNDLADADGFKIICETAENTMYAQKFAGAAAGLLNANLIARDLGLFEKSAGGDATDLADAFRKLAEGLPD